MRSMKLLATAAAMSLSTVSVAAPAVSATSPAAKLSVAKTVRADTKSKGSQLAGAGIVPLVLAAAIVAGGIYIAVDDDDSDSN